MLFKYRSLNEFKFFVDILAKSRFYAAPYFDLNDPMEGQYLYPNTNDFNDDIKDVLKGRKNKIRICSLSRDPENALMWSHYANGHYGVVVGVDVNRTRYDIRPVDYDGLMQLNMNNINQHSAIDILTHKLEAWSYEEEERVFVEGEHFIEVELKEVICGSRMSNQDYSLVSDLVDAICPNVRLIKRPRNHA